VSPDRIYFFSLLLKFLRKNLPTIPINTNVLYQDWKPNRLETEDLLLSICLGTGREKSTAETLHRSIFTPQTVHGTTASSNLHSLLKQTLGFIHLDPHYPSLTETKITQNQGDLQAQVFIAQEAQQVSNSRSDSWPSTSQCLGHAVTDP